MQVSLCASSRLGVVCSATFTKNEMEDIIGKCHDIE
jgi:hypothetical protein